MSVIYALLFAFLYGIVEQSVFRQVDHPTPILGPLTWYHLVIMGPMFIAVGIFTYWPLIPAMFVTADITFFLFHPSAVRGPDSWVNFGLGGFHVAGSWVPWTYVIGVGVSVVLLLVL